MGRRQNRVFVLVGALLLLVLVQVHAQVTPVLGTYGVDFTVVSSSPANSLNTQTDGMFSLGITKSLKCSLFLNCI
jgi:hypothetical protein